MSEAATLSPTYYDSKAYHIDEKKLDKRALKIVYQLKEAGFEAYLVGGCIRDLLLNVTPKDFDIATNARPEEVAGLFRNCRLIGRRFRLAHIHFGRDIIEVATFRASSDKEAVTDQYGHVLEDNHYGSIEEDVVRRDFTINALYYDVETHKIIDYLSAMEDIKSSTIKLIGEPEKRYTQDPVRMLRAARFAAKLGMQLESETEKAIAHNRDSLKAVPPARLFDEAQKLFLSGYGMACYKTLQRFNLFTALFPDTKVVFEHENKAFAAYGEKIMQTALLNTDRRIEKGKPVTIAFLYAAFLWPVYQMQYQGLLKERDNWHSAMHEAVDTVLIAANERVSIPVRLRSMIREIWTLQARLELAGTRMKKVRSLLGHPRFRAAYDFLLIRETAGEPVGELARWWQEMQDDPDIEPEVYSNEAQTTRRRSNKRRKRSKTSG